MRMRVADGRKRVWLIGLAVAAVSLCALVASTFLPRPTSVSGNPASDITLVAAGGAHTCSLSSSGAVRCWGRNNEGQLGTGTFSDSLVPIEPLGLSSGMISISAGEKMSCAITTAETVKCWGDAENGPGTTVPADVGLFAQQVSVGDSHACAVTVTGGAECWGRNHLGQLGSGGSYEYSSTPVDVLGLTSGVAAVSAGAGHTCALLVAGSVKCWGQNSAGQLGDGTRNSSSTPVDVQGLGTATALGVGRLHSCAVIIGGGVRCWGLNEHGQSGVPTGEICLFPTPYGCNTVPVDVYGINDGAARIAAGLTHTCALTTAGGIRCWGDNAFGRLGDGTSNDSAVPVDVLGLSSGVLSVSAGGQHTCAVTVAGGLKCWGANPAGQLGDGTTEARLSPTDVVVAEPKPTPTAACGPSGCPSPTATPVAPSGEPRMSLGLTGGECSGLDGTKCYVGLEQTFKLSISLDTLPETGSYFGVQMQIAYPFGGGITYLPSSSPIQEFVWPDLGGQAVRAISEYFQRITHAGGTAFIPPFPESMFLGKIVELSFECSATPSATTIALRPYAPGNTLGSGVSVLVGPLMYENIPARTLPGRPDAADELTINCVEELPATPTPVPPTPGPVGGLSFQPPRAAAGASGALDTTAALALIGGAFMLTAAVRYARRRLR